MRKVTEQIATAFINGESKTVGNTTTDGSAVFLHGNKIAEKRNNTISFTLAGWNTVTTRERLNGLLNALGSSAGFNQKKGEPYFNGKLINADKWVDLA